MNCATFAVAPAIDPEATAVAGTLAIDGRFVAAAVKQAEPLYRRAIEALLQRAQDASTLQALRTVLLARHTLLGADLAELLERVLVTADLAGRATLYEQAKRQASFAVGDLPEGFDFEPLSNEEALRFFRQRVPVSDAAFRALTATMKPLAFRIADIEDGALLTALRDKLDEALQGELTLGEFLKQAPQIFEAHGVTSTNPHHLETLFRTNTMTALNAGKWDEAQDPDLQDLFPLYRYSAILDERTRPEHAAMHGFTAPQDDPTWTQWWPPNGFNCRCTVVPLSTAYIDRHQVRASRSMPAGLQPDPGFRTNPKAALDAWASQA